MEVVHVHNYLPCSHMKNITVVITGRKFEVIFEKFNVYGICINVS